MISKRNIGSILLVSIIALSLAVAIRAADDATSGPVHEFKMTASSYDFDPDVITVKKGEKVRLIITATDRRHGIKIDGYDIDQVLAPGDPTTIEFAADKSGEFEFKCSVYCGFGHRKMKGKLVVEE
jgi:cytochrome c oxidase subunit II